MATQTQLTDPNITKISEATVAPRQTASAITGSDMGGSITAGSQQRNIAVSKSVSENLESPQIPESAVQKYTDIQAQANEFADPTASQFQVGTTGNQITAAQGQAAAPVTATDTGGTATMTAATVGTGAQATAATDQQLNPAAMAEAAIGELPPEAMVQSQMNELLAGIESGEIPTWAQPAVDAVEGQLAARGLSRSSVGQAALTNAIIQTALPMAQQNAQAITQNFQQDKAAQTQVSLANASAAQQLQFQNLSNEQQAAMLTAQQRQQALLSDQAAQNAAAQFNAASENQTRQFMANLKTNVDLSTAARLDAMTQYNVGQQNAIAQFNENNRFQREQFNAQNATAIEQSNLQWRRQINQANTAGINAVNQANAMNAFNLSNQALTFMWQEMRDSAKWSFEAAQNDEQRKAALVTAAMGNEASTNVAAQKYISALGSAAVNLWNRT
jgi:hypothetical protein